ncbi:probable cation transporter HKT1;4 [Humulus lupulus]|uniref:probable cation transporter HKT1;4 n=1 Tax=Humulus lupulus TaxID=3486 RepID=UPI002B404CB2|nr:probable cation transporter HKT1;4 [Humulus lupulus]
MSNIQVCSTNLSTWHKSKFGSLSKDIKQTHSQIIRLQNSQKHMEDHSELRQTERKLDGLLRKEEVFWHQRSRIQWIKAGDQNTNFFHQKARERQKNNSIKDEMNMSLEAPFSLEEIKDAVFSMPADKSPGPDGFSALLQQPESRKEIKGLRIANTAPFITHLFFADDSLIIVQATERSLQAIQNIFPLYSTCSGQMINFTKSLLYFSPNTSEEIATLYTSSLNMQRTDSIEKYLGLPLLGDSLFWHYTNHGNYSVKSGYNLASAMDIALPSSSVTLIAMCVCPLICFGEDSNAHAVFWCPSSKEILDRWDYPFMSDRKEDISFKEILLYASEILEKENFQKMLIIAWAICTQRTTEQPIQNATSTNQRREDSGNQSNILSVDAALSNQTEMIEFGAIILSPEKEVIAALSKPLKGMLLAFQAEAIALLVALNWAQRLGIQLDFNPFLVQLFYFLSVSFFGYLVLASLKPRTNHSFKPTKLDMLFTTVSAITVSSMSTVEMEVFSNIQLIILTILMFVGGEVFTSLLELYIKQLKLKKTQYKVASVNCSDNIIAHSPASPKHSSSAFQQIELDIVLPQTQTTDDHDHHQSSYLGCLKYSSVKYLSFIVLGYLLVVHIFGVTMVFIYVSIISSAKNVLKEKGLDTLNFSIFTTVSTFTNCGFIPTNENMMIFSKNSGLLLILLPQVLLGNTFFPSCIRFSIWVLGKFDFGKEKSEYLLRNNKDGDIGCLHFLLPGLHCWLLVPTVLGFIFIQFVLFCSLEWNSESLGGLTWYQKIIGSLFQSVNTRYTGETIVDVSIISPAILVLFLFMMYLPPYTSFLPLNDGEDNVEHCLNSGAELMKKSSEKRGGKAIENYIFSQLSYLLIFIILVCVAERRKIKEDPLNFSVQNIAFEVISAYGNVGFTTGYSCKRQIHPSNDCEDKWYGFAGRWSDQSKIILMVVMLFGRLKKYNMKGGKAWKLL